MLDDVKNPLAIDVTSVKDEDITFDPQQADNNMKKIIECAEFLENQTNQKAKNDESMFNFNNLPIIVLA